MQATTEKTSDGFVVRFPGFDEIRLRKFSIDEDIPLIHDWVNRDYAKFWGLRGKSLAEVRYSYEEALARPGHHIYMGILGSTGECIFQAEVYDPRHDLVGNYYRVRNGDVGTHLMMGPPSRKKLSELTHYVFWTLNAFVFSDATALRIVGEPDVANIKVQSRALQAGYRPCKVIYLPYKTAQLNFLTREYFERIDPLAPPPRPELRWRPVKVKFHILLGRALRKFRLVPIN
jgi:hypothetical protein